MASFQLRLAPSPLLCSARAFAGASHQSVQTLPPYPNSPRMLTSGRVRTSAAGSGERLRRIVRGKGDPGVWSGRRGSNSRHPAWKAGALPLSYSRSRPLRDCSNRSEPRPCWARQMEARDEPAVHIPAAEQPLRTPRRELRIRQVRGNGCGQRTCSHFHRSRSARAWLAAYGTNVYSAPTTSAPVSVTSEPAQAVTSCFP